MKIFDTWIDVNGQKRNIL